LICRTLYLIFRGRMKLLGCVTFNCAVYPGPPAIVLFAIQLFVYFLLST
jgi:hypothetical protein